MSYAYELLIGYAIRHLSESRIVADDTDFADLGEPPVKWTGQLRLENPPTRKWEL